MSQLLKMAYIMSVNIVSQFQSATALEVCNLDKRILQSLDYTVNRFFMKLFRTF